MNNLEVPQYAAFVNEVVCAVAMRIGWQEANRAA